MNITKKQYVRMINSLKQQQKLDEKYSEYIAEMFDTPRMCYNHNELIYDMINLLVELSGDQFENNLIAYYLFEQSTKESGYLWEEDGTKVDVSTPEKMYDYLEKIEK